jgi:hypothetical protein
MRKHRWSLFVSGLAAGVASVLACHHVQHAKAAPSDCTAWQYAVASDVMELNGTQPVALGTITLPGSPPKTIYAWDVGGWEPFAEAADTGSILVRRCKP